MKKWVLLGCAILTEVTATMSLRATVNNGLWIPVVVIGYLLSFYFMSRTLRAGLTIGVTYGIWGGTGVILTAIFGAIIFGETLSTAAIFGIGLIVIGVMLVQTGNPRGEPTAHEEGRS